MNKQAGVTLISLLIGLVIAMFCIVAVLAVYRTTVKTGADSRIASNHDAQLQNGLTTAQMLVQNAGFGLDGSAHFIVHANITASINGANQNITSAVLWRYKNGTEIVCQGLADIPNQDNTKRHFVLLQGLLNNAACNDTQSLTALTWSVQSVIANLNDYSSDQSNPPQITWTTSTASCTPYGAGKIDDSVQHLILIISAKTSSQQIAHLNAVEVPVCVLNIVV